MDFKTIVLIVNISNEKASKQAKDLISWLKKRDIRIRLASDDATSLKCTELGCRREDLLEDTDLIITLGGDGTVLRAVNLLKGSTVPILAVNHGKFGFLQEIDPQGLHEDVETVLNGKYYVEKRDLLKAEFDGREYLLLNDLVLSHDGFRIMHLRVYINGTFFYEYAADGIVLSTATGSTAYAFSAGGPIINPQAKVSVLTPINPHALLNRSIVLEEGDVVKTKVASISGNLKIYVDGLLFHQGASLDVQVRSSKKFVNLIRLGEKDFFGFLRKKLAVLSGVNDVD